MQIALVTLGQHRVGGLAGGKFYQLVKIKSEEASILRENKLETNEFVREILINDEADRLIKNTASLLWLL